MQRSKVVDKNVVDQCRIVFLGTWSVGPCVGASSMLALFSSAHAGMALSIRRCTTTMLSPVVSDSSLYLCESLPVAIARRVRCRPGTFTADSPHNLHYLSLPCIIFSLHHFFVLFSKACRTPLSGSPGRVLAHCLRFLPTDFYGRRSVFYATSIRPTQAVMKLERGGLYHSAFVFHLASSLHTTRTLCGACDYRDGVIWQTMFGTFLRVGRHVLRSSGALVTYLPAR